jgi:quinol-cytochrome oxidoreductase complex cytochrome b subunit
MARDAALFLVLAALVDGLLATLTAGPGSLLTTFYLAFFIHAGFTLYDGRFDALRTVTWIVLIAAWAAAEFVEFLGYLIPWGQLTFWLASQLAALRAGPEILASLDWLASRLAAFPLWSIPLLCILCLDVAVMHCEAWRRRSLAHAAVSLIAVVAVVVFFGVIAGLLVGRPAPLEPDVGGFPTPMKIIPPWYELPFYAMLRAVPDKLAGFVVMYAAMAVPLIWPWMHADALRTGPLRRMWLVLCLALAAVWIGLTYLGSRPPEPVSVHVAQALAVFYFAFFLIWPPLLHKFAVVGDSRMRPGEP